ncbi:MAG: translation initiation factor IF-3 [Candidatus Lightella neohaematopini]|nr:translation initiation factor IF-3 [Candidatus Lightella neohaematopini]
MKINIKSKSVKFKNRINEEIKADKVRLINIDLKQIGIVSLQDALLRASKLNSDLIEINPNIIPPVCRIINYGKFIYEKSKLIKEQKKKQKSLNIKEIKFRPNTQENDYNIKLRNIIRLLNKGNKIKVTLKFRGREIVHQQIGINMLKRMKNDLHKLIIMDNSLLRIEGKQISIMLTPQKNKNKI